MIASSVFAGVSLTVHPRWHDMLSLLWWHPAGKFSEHSLDWHCPFFGTDLVSVSKETMTEKKLLRERKKIITPLIECLNVNSIL